MGSYQWAISQITFANKDARISGTSAQFGMVRATGWPASCSTDQLGSACGEADREGGRGRGQRVEG